MVASEKTLSVKELKNRTDGNEMDLSLLGISKVPVQEIASVTKANSIDLSCNLILVLPEGFCSMLKHIIKLDISKNQLTKLPEDLGKMEQLQHLDLYNNQLKSLPVSFCHLRTLKWLDLKDNPLDDFYKKIVGDCLDDKQCRQCAQNVVTAMKSVSSNQEREKQKRLKLEREKEAAKKEEAKRLAERKKQEKKKERELKRLQWEEQQKQSLKQEVVENSDKNIPISRNSEISSNQPTKSPKGNFSVWLIIIAAMLAVGLGLYFYCQEYNSDQYCMLFIEKSETLWQTTRMYAGTTIDFVKNFSKTAIDAFHLGKGWCVEKFYHSTTG